MKTITATFLGSLFVVLFMTACVHEDVYPASWGAIEATEAGRQCPYISGLYAEVGEVTAWGCHTHQEKCPHLSYNLLGAGTGYAEVYDDSRTPAFSAGTTHVELTQRGDQAIEVILWQSGFRDGKSASRGRVIGQERLAMDDGDYSCGGEGLRLQPRGVYFLAGISNLVGVENRTFNRTVDRALVMKSEETFIAHHTFVPFGGGKTIWVRWQATADPPQ
ncbi:MAG: hypothetical protein MUE49_12565 [Rhodospirillales bacterium]|jgi:hypothetical protein|nr:hypothetical protein [Rhodospirillales bacterium]